jgi:ABC-type multidrug transport system ATPase subunit
VFVATTAIDIQDLSKTFGKGESAVHAVQHLNLEIATNQVYGFLGPNGAGKSTTIRILMDLIRPSAGETFIFGQPTAALESRRRVGALVEGADFYPFMSGWENLVVLDRTAGTHQPDRIEALIHSVDLSDRARQSVGSYSTGMKQRLGLAAALLSDPELLILDEPTNGLDPAGIQDMRSFIRDQARVHSKTVFLSSHLLNEVEQVCDHVAIIHQGRLLMEGPVGTLLEGDVHQTRLQVRPMGRACQVISARWSEVLDPAEIKDSHWLTLMLPPDQIPAVVAELVRANVQVYQVIHKRQSLEELFIAVTNHAGQKDDA